MPIGDKTYRFLLSSGLTVGGVGAAWLLMKWLVPTREQMLKKLPEEETTPEALAAADRRTEQFLTVLKENMKSKQPVWKVIGVEEAERRQKRRREIQKRKEAKLKENEFQESEHILKD